MADGVDRSALALPFVIGPIIVSISVLGKEMSAGVEFYEPGKSRAGKPAGTP